MSYTFKGQWSTNNSYRKFGQWLGHMLIILFPVQCVCHTSFKKNKDDYLRKRKMKISNTFCMNKGQYTTDYDDRKLGHKFSHMLITPFSVAYICCSSLWTIAKTTIQISVNQYFDKLDRGLLIPAQTGNWTI